MVRVTWLVTRPLWFDEIFTAWAARLSPASLIEALRLDSGPPGFYLLEKPFAALTERAGGDWLLRVPSLLAASALVFAAKTLPRPSRLPFVAFASTSALVTLYAAEARPYALLGLCGLAVFLLALTREETAARLVALALVSAAALYLHYLALFVVGVVLLLALRARRWKSGLAVAAGAAAFLPWIPVLRAQPRAAIAWMRESAVGSLAGFLSSLGGVGRIPAPFGGPAPAVLFVAGLLAGALLLAAASVAARRDDGVREALFFSLLVLAAAFLAGLWRPIAFAGRTEMAVLPVWIWGAGQACRTSRAARVGTAAAAVLGTAAALVLVFSPRAADTRDIAGVLSQAARRDDIVVAAAGFYLPLRLEAERGRLAAPVRALPEESADHPGWFVPALPGDDEARALVREAEALPPGGRLFLVIPPPYATPALLAALESSGGRVRELVKSRDLLVMLRTSPASP